jgi:polysaccharide biosynthesis protein PslH
MSDLIFLAHRMPLPPEKGETARAWHLLRRLAKEHRVHLGCFYDHPSKAQHIGMLSEFCASVLCLPISPAVRRLKSFIAFIEGKPVSAAYGGNARLMRWIAETIEAHHPSHALVSGVAMASYLENYRLHTRAVDMVELASEKWRQRAEQSRWPLSDFYWWQERALLAREMRAASRFDHTFFASAAEMNLFARRAPRAPAHLIALRSGVDHEYFRPGLDCPNPYPTGRKIVAFSGALDYPPNVEGVSWFASEVMTMLRHRFPTIDFWIVGDHPVHAVRALARRDIHLARPGADVRPYLAHADAVVAPLRVVRGIENNVLEGMAMGKPVIATPAALDGLHLVLGEEILCSASAPGFATCVATALGGRATTIAELGRKRVVADYGWEAALRPLDELLGPSKQSLAGAS